MKKILISIILLAIHIAPALSLPDNEYVVPLCRQFAKELFEPNSAPFLSPTLSIVNATTNSGFYHTAYVPAKVNKPYFRISLNLFYGPISNSMRTFSPNIPSKEFNMQDILPYIDLNLIQGTIGVKDTVALLNYMFLNLIDMGVKDGSIKFPEKSATLLGGEGANLIVEDYVLLDLYHKHPVYELLAQYSTEMAQEIENILKSLVATRHKLEFFLPNGGNLNNIFVGVPQLEIGSLFGTELLIRFIPKIDMGTYIGEFSFWGLGLKHSISQYFYKDKNRDGNNRIKEHIAPFDLAVQAVYQRTSLVNSVGVTQSTLSSNTDIYCFNINASKQINNWLEIYSGLNYELLDITGKYEYLLPVGLQRQIGLMREDSTKPGIPIIIDPPEFPGDQEPQTTHIKLSHSQFKFTFGGAATLGNFTLFLDYSITNFPVLSAGLKFKF